MPRRVLISTALTLAVLIAACSDDTTSPEATTGALAGAVTDMLTDQPVVGATVLVATDEIGIVGVAETGVDGRYALAELPAGALLVYALDEHFKLVESHEARVQVRGGKTVTADLLMVSSDATDPLTYRIAGQVTDADTGAPVAGAWIVPIGYGEMGNSVRYLTNNSGLIVAVSDADGSYSLPTWPVREFYPDGPVIGLGPVSCAAPGYRPRTFVGAGPSSAHEAWLQGGLLPAPADSVLVLDVALAPIPAGGLAANEVGTLRGRIVHEGSPREGVMVTTTLTTLAAPDTIYGADKVAVSGGSMRSRADGTFELDLEPGHYGLRAGLLPDDGWCREGGPGMIEIVAGQTLDVGDVGVWPAVRPVSPARGAEVAYPLTMLSWTSVPGAERYEVELSSDWGIVFSVATTDTFHVLDDASKLAPGTHRYSWRVYASLQFEPPFYTRIAWFEVPAVFTVTGAPEN
ncbi:MAG: hypothetical protein GY838_02105 [bacterium]|nr:hypothetical protein [bacterium]